MGLKEFLEKSIKDYKKNNTPEKVKERLKNQIEIEKLKMEREELIHARRTEKAKSFTIGDTRFK